MDNMKYRHLVYVQYRILTKTNKMWLSSLKSVHLHVFIKI